MSSVRSRSRVSAEQADDRLTDSVNTINLSRCFGATADAFLPVACFRNAPALFAEETVISFLLTWAFTFCLTPILTGCSIIGFGGRLTDSCWQLLAFERFLVEMLFDLGGKLPSGVDETGKRTICCPTIERHSSTFASERDVALDILKPSRDLRPGKTDKQGVNERRAKKRSARVVKLLLIRVKGSRRERKSQSMEIFPFLSHCVCHKRERIVINEPMIRSSQPFSILKSSKVHVAQSGIPW